MAVVCCNYTSPAIPVHEHANNFSQSGSVWLLIRDVDHDAQTQPAGTNAAYISRLLVSLEIPGWGVQG